MPETTNLLKGKPRRSRLKTDKQEIPTTQGRLETKSSFGGEVELEDTRGKVYSRIRAMKHTTREGSKSFDDEWSKLLIPDWGGRAILAFT